MRHLKSKISIHLVMRTKKEQFFISEIATRLAFGRATKAETVELKIREPKLNRNMWANTTKCLGLGKNIQQ
jgi:hypothetical protein